MAAVTLRMEMMPHVYQLGLQSNATIETAIPIYSQQNKGITAHTILVPAYFDKIFNLPFRMHQALNGLVTATSQMRYDGSCQFVEYHRAAFLQSVH